VDNTAKLWDAASGKLIASFQHQNWIWHGAFSADGTRILTASADHSAKLWDAASGKLLVSFNPSSEIGLRN
jgi:WD40 repeat protein